jgi:hypothetical protein
MISSVFRAEILMKPILTLATCTAALFFAGCAGTKQFVPMPDQTKSVEDPAKGRIYLMRPSSFGAAVGMNVADNGHPIGNTGPQGYLCWEREPGDVIVSSASENTSRVSLPVRPGSIHYVLQNIRWGIWVARTDLEVVDEVRGSAELKKCKPAKVVAPPK